MDKFNDMLIQLVGASTCVGLATAKAMANPDGINEVGRSIIADQVKGTIENLRQLQASLEIIGKKNR